MTAETLHLNVVKKHNKPSAKKASTKWLIKPPRIKTNGKTTNLTLITLGEEVRCYQPAKAVNSIWEKRGHFYFALTPLKRKSYASALNLTAP